MGKYIPRLHKYVGCCYFGTCPERATHGFRSLLGNVQRAKYCHSHAKEIQEKQGQFPNCAMIQIAIIGTCKYCGKSFDNLYPSAKFCCRKHKELNHHVTKIHIKPEYKLKRKVRENTKRYKVKLGDKCSLCGSTEKLELHHKDYNSTAKENCELLCRKCHRQVRHGLKG